MSIQGAAPPAPTAPPFLLSSANGATAVLLFWAGVDGAMSYVVERKQELQAWAQLGTVAGNVTWFTDSGALPSTAYSYRVKAVNAGGESDYSPTAAYVTWSQQQEWLYQNYGSLDALSSQEMLIPGHDGAVPLLRYAFGLSATGPCRTYQPGQANGGAPAIWLDRSRNKLCVEFMRRKATTDPGVTYAVQFSSTLRDWVTNAPLVSTYSVNTLWECVRYEEVASPGDSRYCRVVVGTP
jgi:hypothetical protein